MSVVLESPHNQAVANSKFLPHKVSLKPLQKNITPPASDAPLKGNNVFDKHTEELKNILKEIVGDKELTLNQDKALRELLVLDAERLKHESAIIDETAKKKNKDLAKKIALYATGAIPIDVYQLGIGLISGPVTGAVRSAETLDGQTLNWRLIKDPKATSEEQLEDFLNKYAPSPAILTGVGLTDVFNPVNSAYGRPGGNIFNPLAHNYSQVIDNINKNADNWGDNASQRKTNIIHAGIGIPLAFGAAQFLGRCVFPAMVGSQKEKI